MDLKKIPITKVGLKKLEEERNHLISKERPTIIEAIASARELGDLSENAEYHAARERQSFVEGRIQELNDIIARSEVIDITNIRSDKVQFGSTVQVEDLDTSEVKTFKIVGEYETDADKGLISYISPLAKALIGRKVNDIVDISTTKGEKSLEIKKLEYV